MMHFANQHRSEREFQEGDYVYLKLQPFRRNVLNNAALHKLAARYFGPFKVLQHIGQVAYKLELPSNTRIHLVFHMSMLKKHKGLDVPSSVTLPLTDGDGNFSLVPEAILASKVVQRGHMPVTQVLIKWENANAEDATWEDLSTIQNQFPEFDTRAAVRAP